MQPKRDIIKKSISPIIEKIKETSIAKIATLDGNYNWKRVNPE